MRRRLGCPPRQARPPLYAARSCALQPQYLPPQSPQFRHKNTFSSHWPHKLHHERLQQAPHLLGAPRDAPSARFTRLKAVAQYSPPFLQLVSAAAVPVAKVALFCVVGAWASKRGLLPPEGRRVLSGLTLHVFTPCLLFSKLGPGGGLRELAGLWGISVNMVASHVVGLLLGLLAARTCRVPPRLLPHLVLSCGVGNVGNLPFVLLAGLAEDPRLPFAAALGQAVAGDLAMRYVALSNFTASLIQFPLTYIFLQKPHHPPTAPTAPPTPTIVITATIAPTQLPRDPPPPTQPALDETPPHPARPTAKPPRPPLPPNGLPAPTSAAACPSASGASPSVTAAGTIRIAEEDAGGWWSVLRPVLSGILTPPTVVSLLAVGVASVKGLQDAFFHPTGCLRLLAEVVDALGAVCIPSLLLVLGANLGTGPGGGKAPGGELTAGCMAAVAATRLVLLPAFCGAALVGAWRAGLLPGIDLLALLVMLVMHATPTAVLVHSVATLFSNAEDEVAALLFWQYTLCLLTLPAAIGVMLSVVGPAAAAPAAWMRMGTGTGLLLAVMTGGPG